MTGNTVYTFPGIAADVPGPGSGVWTNVNNVKAIDSAPARPGFFTADQIVLREAKLVIANAITGTGVGSNQSAASNTTIGGSANLWGATPTVAQVNDSSFGIALAYGIQAAGPVFTTNSHYLQLQGFNISLPSNATINGIEVLLTQTTVLVGGGLATLELEGVQLRVYYTWNPRIIADGVASGIIYSARQEQLQAEKTFDYVVTDKLGNYVGSWRDVTNVPTIRKEINSGLLTMDLELGRTEQSLGSAVDNLVTEGAENVITEDLSEALLIETTAASGVGPGTDAELNYEVTMLAKYGNYGELISETGEIITTETDELIMIDDGAPMGKVMFSGFITEWGVTWGREEGISITAVSHSDEANNILMENSELVLLSNYVGTSNGTDGYTIGGGGPDALFSLAQTFTPASTFSASRVVLRLGKVDLASTSGTLSVYMGTPDSPGAFISSIGLQIPQGVNDVVVDLGVNYQFLIATQYFIRLDTDKTGTIVWYSNNSNAYAAGNGYIFSGGAWLQPANLDFLFKLTGGSGVTTFNLNSMDPSDIFKFAINFARTQGSRINYDTTSVEQTGTVVSVSVKTNTVMELLQLALKAAPADWYLYFDPAENKFHFHPRPTAVNRFFTLKEDIVYMKLGRSIDAIENTGYFSGGGTPSLFVTLKNPASITSWRRGLVKLSDSRVTDLASAKILLQSELDENDDPAYIGSVQVITQNKRYIEDIFSSELGQLNGFGNFGSFVDSLSLQMSKMSYEGDTLTIDVGTLRPPVSKRVEDIRRNLDAIEQEDNPNSPS